MNTKKLNYCLAAFILLTFSSGFAVRLWASQPRYGTSSKPTQNGITFVGAYRGIPKVYENWKLFGYDSRDQTCTWVIFEVVDSRGLNGLEARLVGKNGLKEMIGHRIEARSEDKQLIGYALPDCYSPEFRNSKLVISDSRKELGIWQLTGIPEPTRLIDPKTPERTSGRAMGVRLDFLSPALQLGHSNGFDHESPRYWLADVKVSGIDSSRGDEYEISPHLEQCEWHKPSTNDQYTMAIKNGITRIQLDTLTPYNTSKLVFGLKLRKFRTYDEPVVLRHVIIKRIDQQENAYRIVSCANPVIQTPSGIHLSLDTNQRPDSIFIDRVAVKFHSNQPADKMKLPKSPLAAISTQPIQLTLSDGSSASGTDFTWFLKREFNKGLDQVVVPEIKIVLRQKMIIHEQAIPFAISAKGCY